MKLEVGMYVRGFRGINKIIKIEPYNDTFFYYTDGKEGKPFYFERHIKRSSFNPIDLIEVGDYVNGCKVHKIANCITIILDNEENISWVNPSDIKSIVTKEQFQKMEYRIGE